jgi:hypothetical protein
VTDRGRKRQPAERPSRIPRTVDFGFDPDASPHHFAVVVGRQSVAIVERFDPPPDDASADAPERDEAPKATLTRYLWDRIKAPAAAEFNRRLQADGQRKGGFAGATTLLAPHFGKELTLLAWAVEDQDGDPTPLPAMIANWNGLAPEERWWFYTTVNAAAPAGRDRGWRKAIKIAFAENPVHLAPTLQIERPPRARTAGRRRRKDEDERRDPDGGQLGFWIEGDNR